MPDFTKVEPGDTVVRLIAGEIPMELLVTKVDDRLIYCHSNQQDLGRRMHEQMLDVQAALGVTVRDTGEDAWTFDRLTGVEEDLDLQWGLAFGRTGSMLVDFTKGGI